MAVAWDQRPEYLAYTNWTPIPGVTSYAFPRRGSGTDVTQFHPGQAYLSEHNLPDIMYQLRPCKKWKRFKDSDLPGPKKNPDGSPVYEQYTRPGDERRVLLDFKILPDKISTKEGWWYHEFVRRMDPRIRNIDLIMREEATAERLRMSDQRYINIHLNTPGYRLYRPAWKMLSWHVLAGGDKKNQRKQLVLDSLSDAQKQANTTRGSTPGLINPALGDVPGNRVALPAVEFRKLGPKKKDPAIQPAQVSQVPQAQQAPQSTQVHPAPQPVQAPDSDQSQQSSQCTQTRSSNVATRSSVASAARGARSRNVTKTAAAKGHSDTRGFANTQARDAAAMPPPPLPHKSRSDHSIQPQVLSSHPEPPYVPDSKNPVMSVEEMATMSAKSDEAMAEINWLYEPFRDPCASLQDPPPMDLSAELIDALGIGFLFPNRAASKERERRRPIAFPKQGKKRKERCRGDEGDEDYGNFQQVQLDVERQASRPVKRAKSVHNSSSQLNNGQQPHLNPRLGSYESGHSRSETFGGATRHDAQPSQHAWVEDFGPQIGGLLHGEHDWGFVGQTPNQIFEPYQRTTFADAPPPNETMASPYLPTTIAREDILDLTAFLPSGGASADSFPHENREIGQALKDQSYESTTNPSTQQISHESVMAQLGPRAADGSYMGSSEHASQGRGYRPYANSRQGVGLSMEAPQMQQLDDRSSPPTGGAQTVPVDGRNTPDVTLAGFDYASLSNPFPDTPLDPLFESYMYGNDGS